MIFDVSANIGLTTAILAAHRSDATIYDFEPSGEALFASSTVQGGAKRRGAGAMLAPRYQNQPCFRLNDRYCGFIM